MNIKIGFGFLSYNRIELTKKSINSILKQKFDAGIIVDNCSTDVGWKYLKDIANKKIKFIRNGKNYFPGFARNQMIDELIQEVDVIVFMDNDIVLMDNCFEVIKDVFKQRNNYKIGQLTPLPAPEDFIIHEFRCGNYFLAQTISNASSAITAVLTDLFKKGLRWKNLVWNPENNNEIGEDYFLSRDIKNMGMNFFWFGTKNQICCENLGRTNKELRNNFEYYLKTFAERGMLSRLVKSLPDKENEILQHKENNDIPELHGTFDLETNIECNNKMNAQQLSSYFNNYYYLIPKIKPLLNKRLLNKTESNKLEKYLVSVRDYFDNLEYTNSIFSQKTLQAAIYFNRLLRKNKIKNK